ncbi:hypothetical protein COCOBI_05-2890 [Coccomyxa sp. Obi]|nr:hypothetical protein COCOBI_05-2890 [Coccomyxa sp. Obi]
MGVVFGSPVLVLSVLLFALASASSELLAEDALIVPGTTPLDQDGIPVQAHGGGVIRLNDTFFWYGESYKRPMLGDFLSEGVNLYSSTNLTTWTFEGLVFNGTEQMQDMPLGPPFRIERPKILYNAAYGQFVLLFHADTPRFSYPSVGVAVAADIRGPYKWVRAFKPDGLDSYDMGVFQESDGTAFLVRSINNDFLGISQLTPNYTDTTGLVSVTPRGEGPSIFKPTAKDYYLIASHLTYWNPNPPMLFHASASSLRTAAWHNLTVPAQGEGANTTYNSQSSFVFPLEFVDGTVLHIYMGDRWNFAGPGSVENATYVWLPLLPNGDGSGYTLQHADSWRPSDYRDQARLPPVYDRAAHVADTGLSAAEQAWVDSLLAPRKKQQDRNNTVNTAAST